MSWKKVDFEVAVKDITGGNRKFQSSEYKITGEFPIIDQGDGLIAGYTDERNTVKRDQAVVVFGDHTKLLKYVDFDFCLGADGVKVLLTFNLLDAKFLYYFLRTINLPNVGYSRHYKFLKDIKIPLPPLPIQKRITEILDAADALKHKDRELLKKYDELAQAIFIDMFGDPVKNEKGWEVTTMEKISTKVTDGDHATPRRSETGYKLLSCRNVKNGYIDFNAGLDYVDEEEFKRMVKRCNPEKGDILISCSGTIGRTTAVKIDEPFVLVRSAALVKPRKDLINSYYLETYLQTPHMQRVMKKYANTSSQANLFTGPIKLLPIVLPQIELQNKFACRIELLERHKFHSQKNSINSENLFNSLIQKAFKGELVS